MQYKLRDGITIRSENAAKPSSQASEKTLSVIRSLPKVECAMDYGCGKARYTPAISKTADFIYLVDSKIQLFREQRIHGRLTSVAKFYDRSNSTHIISADQDRFPRKTVDRVFCFNVLSAIPCFRARRKLLETARECLTRDGEMVVNVQYRNSDFTRMSKLPKAQPYLDGFLVDSLRGWSFYGLISPDRLLATLKRSGFRVVEHHLYDGTAFARAVAS